MPQSEIRQFEKLINSSSHVLIMLPENPYGDHYCSALAIAYFCDMRSIKTTIAFTDPYEQISLFSFLPKPKTTKIVHSISGSRDLILSFKTKYNKILDVRTEQTQNTFNIYVTPERGMIDSRDFSFTPGSFPYDIIISLGAVEKESMGTLYEEIPDIFYELPIINIDNKSSNEKFGQLNIINPVASSVSEIVGDIFEQISKNKLSKNCAQCLLTGIISQTHSFQKHNTTPRAMTLSSRLIEYGADQQIVIKNLYRNLPFSLLKLWGRAMKNFTTSTYYDKTVISSLTYEDIIQTEAKTHHLYSILEKMKENYPYGQIFILLYEDSDGAFIALVDTERSNIDIETEENIIKSLPNNIYKMTLTSTTREDATEEVCKILQPNIRHLIS